MVHGRSPTDDGPVDAPSPLLVVLRIERIEPLAGELRLDGGTPHLFKGWAGLAAALEAVFQERLRATATERGLER